jgi:CBS domain-containing protein
MRTTNKPLLALTAGDLMNRDVIRLPAEMPLRDAAHLLRCSQVSGAPVVDRDGRCIGVLSAADFLRWAECQGRATEEVPLPACPYLVKGRLLTGEEALICTQAEGNCPLQVLRATTGGRHTAICTRPVGMLKDGQPAVASLPGDAVRAYMTPDIVTAGPQTPLPSLARIMLDAHIHRVIVVDDEQRPIGIVSSTDLIAALAHSGAEA